MAEDPDRTTGETTGVHQKLGTAVLRGQLPEVAGVATAVAAPAPRQVETFDRSGEDLPAFRARYAPDLVGEHPRLLDVLDVVRRVADTDCSVLITGESGTGKELVARAIHAASPRAAGAFAPMSCGAVAEGLLESELFGHAKGAFTGAHVARVGRFALADGGTIFLDEVGEMSPSLQVKLLRVLQEREISPVGESRTFHVDVRVLAATHRDLETMSLEGGGFRADLYYRLNVIQVSLPSLSERISDLPLLVEHFIRDRNRRHRREVTGLTHGAMEAMRAYAWPGNIRELQNSVERMVILRGQGALDVSDLPERIREGSAPVPAAAAGGADLPEEGIDLRGAIEQFENRLILQALERTGWNKNRAAALLNLNRTTLVEKLKKKGLLHGDDP